MSFTLCVLLWAVDGHEGELTGYEDGVLRLLVEHGGVVTSRVRRLAGESAELPLEVQILELPDEETLTRSRLIRGGSRPPTSGTAVSPVRS